MLARPEKSAAKTSRPPKSKCTIETAKQKRDEISQFLEKNCLSEISAIMPQSDATKSVAARPDNSGLFNKTDIRIFQELFPDRSIKAQRLIELGVNKSTPTAMPRPHSESRKNANFRIRNPAKKPEADVDKA